MHDKLDIQKKICLYVANYERYGFPAQLSDPFCFLFDQLHAPYTKPHPKCVINGVVT